jgi:hypothetical protein
MILQLKLMSAADFLVTFYFLHRYFIIIHLNMGYMALFNIYAVLVAALPANASAEVLLHQILL